MELEAGGFDTGIRESRDVYARRIAVFPAGSLLAYLGADCVGCFFSEIWPGQAPLSADAFSLGHDIAARHDPALGRELYIASMTVAPGQRGKGIGQALLEAGIRQVCRRHPAIGSALLLVNENWHGARTIYRKNGFVEVQRLATFFAAGDGGRQDGIVMRRPLQAGAEPPSSR